MVAGLRGGEIVRFWYLEFGIRRSSLTRLRNELASCVLVFSCEIVELGSNKRLQLHGKELSRPIGALSLAKYTSGLNRSIWFVCYIYTLSIKVS